MKISYINYLRGALLLPIVLPMLLLQIGSGVVMAVLLISLWIAGIPYLVFALLVLFYVGGSQSRERLCSLMWAAPLGFLPFSVVGWLVHQLIERASNPDLVISAADLIPIVFFTFLMGYAYVFVVNFVFVVLRRIGVVV